MNYRKRKKGADRDIKMYQSVLDESIKELKQMKVLRVTKPLLYDWTDVSKAESRVGYNKFMLSVAEIGKREIVHERARRRVVGRLAKAGGSPALMDGAL